MKYVDGFVLVVPNDKVEDYKIMAQKGGDIWKKHGALEYFECVGEDMNPEIGGMKMLTFPQLAKAGEDETVVFSFIIFNSKEHRNEVNKKVMEDPMMKEMPKEMPFDMEKVAYGGFKAIVEEHNE
ncbi:DUF1428 domain-containing protein [Candidatus Woesearchaeota archaeon]|nr:DUF1428 domain-containing protein [Candidatus Woesearchaeota archaeon]